MVMNADEATALIATRDRTGRLLVVAFQGSLSPQVRTASRMLRSGELGAILDIDAVVWQDWAQGTAGTWRQDPAMSGGGFLFDTGAHMLNTVADLAGEDFTEVAAWLENDGSPVDIRAVVMARLASGALVTMNACGSAIPSCDSDIRVFCSGAILRTGIWGERLELQRSGRPRCGRSGPGRPSHVWEQFLNVRAGREPNPSPPEVGPADGTPVGRHPRVGGAERCRRGHPGRPRGDRGMTPRVTVWNEFRQERVRRAGPGGLPGRDPRRHRRGAARRRARRADGHARRAGARPDRGGPRRDRRADLVGPRGPRRGRRRDRRPRPARASSTGWA